MSYFQWSSNLKSNVDDVSAVYQPQRLELACQPSVRISHILSARFVFHSFEMNFSYLLFTPILQRIFGTCRKNQ